MSPNIDHPRYEPNYDACTIGSEDPQELRKLIEATRVNLQPRNFAEQHLADEVALCVWRLRRYGLMKCAIDRAEYHRLAADHDSSQPGRSENLRDKHRLVLLTLGRLEIRCRRRFRSALRLLRTSQATFPNPSPDHRSATVERG